MTQAPDLRSEPLKAIYVLMTAVLEEAGEAQERGRIREAAALCEEASVLGKAIGIVARRAGSNAAAKI